MAAPNGRRALWLSVAVLAVAVAFTPWFGTAWISPWALLDPGERTLFVEFRLTRTLLAVLAGAAFSLSGCLFQSMLRNSLACPYTLGVSSGAALGAVVAIAFDGWVWAGAVLGAALALTAVAGFGAMRAELSAHALVLAGVSLNSVCGALIVLAQSFIGFSKSFSVTMWLIGSVHSVPLEPLLGYAALSILLGGWIISRAPLWDLVSLGGGWAAARGADVRRAMLLGAVAGSVLTAATVSLSGPIGFIGLMVPHFLRRWAGASNRLLMPLSAILGGAFLLVCDTLARTLFRPAEIPAGVITALIGGPALIWMLTSRRG
jgi:iron complex transport system permease protein